METSPYPNFKVSMENHWPSSRYNIGRLILRCHDVRDDDKMETLPYPVKKSALERQLEKENENNSLRTTIKIVLTDREFYHKERDDLREERDNLLKHLDKSNKELLYLKEKLNNVECDVNAQKKMLREKKIELTDINKKMKENDYKTSLLQETLKKQDELISALKGKILTHEVGNRKINITDQDKMFEREKREIMDGNEFQVKLKHEEIFDLRNHLKLILKADSDMKERIISLEKKIERNDNHERQMKNELKENDDVILDLKVQLQKSQLNVGSLEMKIRNLETEVKNLELKAKHQKEIIDSNKIERSQMSERNKVLEKAVNAKDDLLSRTKVSQQSLGTLQKKEATMNEVITSLKKQIQHLKTEIEHRDHKVKNLQTFRDHQNVGIVKGNDLNKDIRKKEERITELKEKLQQTVTNSKKTEDSMTENIMSLEKKIQHLMTKVQRTELEESHRHERQLNELKEKDDIISDLKKQLHTSNKMTHQPGPKTEERIESLQRKIKQKEAELESIDLKVKRQEEVLDNKTAEITKLCERNNCLEITMNVKDEQLSKANSQLQQSLKTLHKKEAEMDEIISSLNKKIRHLQAEVEQRDLKVNDLEVKIADGKDENTNTKGKDLSKDIREREGRITELKERLQQTLTKLKKTENELDETKTRLSKAMGNRLTDNNPNITDLSDKNRPTKLAERYAELYDNQWTDAFDSLQKHFNTEEKVIHSLLQILQNTMHFCITKGHEQLQELQHVLKFSRKNEDDIPADIRKLIKDCRKAMSSAAVRNLWEMYLSDLRQSTDEASRTALSVSSFTEECIEISWFMMVQDPPVVFAQFVSHGDKLNTDLFKPYTSSGTLVDYMVWPALLLHEGGPVLAKGVAQGYGKKSK